MPLASTFKTDSECEQRAQSERFGGLEQCVVKPGLRVVGHIETNREVDETTGWNSYSAGREPKAARVDAAIRFGDQIAPHEAHLNGSGTVVPQAGVNLCCAPRRHAAQRAQHGQRLNRLLYPLCSMV